ncbi:hypothetical protein [Streptomyces sp. NPDC048659]|uniref:hypothetical protein n=1 Tax=Streptomyces sp. NPDC048659 TaxID=3155489 RepID=UPI00342C876F
MTDRQTFTARAQAALDRAEQLVEKTNTSPHYSMTDRQLDQVARDRQEAGLLIQAAAVWAQLAAASPLLGLGARSGKAAAGQAVMDRAGTPEDSDVLLVDRSGGRGGPIA